MLRELCVHGAGSKVGGSGCARLCDPPASLSKLPGSLSHSPLPTAPCPQIPTSAPPKSLPAGEVWLPPYGASLSHLSGTVRAGNLLMSVVSSEEGRGQQEWLGS